MVRIFGHTLSIDMIVLWAAETLICFLALYTSFNHGHVFPLVPVLHVSEDAALRAADITLLLGVVCFVLGLYKPTAILQIRMLFLTMAVATVFAVPIFWAILGNEPIHPVLLASQRAWLLEITLYWVLLLVATRLLYGIALRSGLFARTVMVVGTGREAADIAAKLGAMRSCLFRITVVTPDELAQSRYRPWRIIPAGTDTAQAASLVKRGRVVNFHTFCETQFGRIDLASLTDPCQAERLERTLGDAMAQAFRRTLDIVAASALLVLTAPVMLLTAVAVKLDSCGPMIYSQSRVGLGGREFAILKFRSMRVDAERDGVAVWASVRDSRVTRVGSFIRKVRLDELPQLINILRGDMSLVGPRPERPSLAATLNAAIPPFHVRTRVKPGLTGWAQINSAYTASTVEAREKLSYDLYYVKNRTLMFDFMIIVATIRILIFQIGSR